MAEQEFYERLQRFKGGPNIRLFLQHNITCMRDRSYLKSKKMSMPPVPTSKPISRTKHRTTQQKWVIICQLQEAQSHKGPIPTKSNELKREIADFNPDC